MCNELVVIFEMIAVFQVETATILYEIGLLITGDPLEPWQDDNSEEH